MEYIIYLVCLSGLSFWLGFIHGREKSWKDFLEILINKDGERFGHVTVTQKGEEVIAVTRTDDEGKVLSVIWQKGDDD